jgi:hypothetical protein
MLKRDAIGKWVGIVVAVAGALLVLLWLRGTSATRPRDRGPAPIAQAPVEPLGPRNVESTTVTQRPRESPHVGCDRSNDGGACTPTEAALLAKDPTGRCYECMTDKGCIDDAPPKSVPGVVTYGDTGLECGDLSTADDQRLCLEALSCVLATNCTRTQSPQKIAASDNCYCGDESGTNCVAGKASGACKSAYEVAAQSAVPWDVLSRMANYNVALGKANTLVQCAVNNSCSTCL